MTCPIELILAFKWLETKSFLSKIFDDMWMNLQIGSTHVVEIGTRLSIVFIFSLKKNFWHIKDINNTVEIRQPLHFLQRSCPHFVNLFQLV